MKNHRLLLLGLTLATALSSPADWPQWQGPSRDGQATAGSPVPTRLPADLKPAWHFQIGGGFASPVMAGNVLAYLDEANGKEVVHLVDAATGKEKWQRAFADSFGDEQGAGPRSTPILDGDRLYVQSCKGEFQCLSLADGKMLWRVNYEDFGAKFLGSKVNEGTATRRGNNGSGVIDGQRIILPVGSKQEASLACFDKISGKLLWKAGSDEAAYSSYKVATLDGVRQTVAFTAEALLGAEPDTGKILWRVPLKTGAKRHTGTPVILKDQVVVNSQTIGLLCLNIKRAGDGFVASPAWTNKQLKINLATPVVVDGHLYSLGANKDFVCVDAATGQLKWSQPGFGRGQKDYAAIIVVGKNLLVLTEDGKLFLIEANPNAYKLLGQVQACGNNWSYPAYSNGRLYLRDNRELMCYDLVPASQLR